MITTTDFVEIPKGGMWSGHRIVPTENIEDLRGYKLRFYRDGRRFGVVTPGGSDHAITAAQRVANETGLPVQYKNVLALTIRPSKRSQRLGIDHSGWVTVNPNCDPLIRAQVNT